MVCWVACVDPQPSERLRRICARKLGASSRPSVAISFYNTV
jgi:hypothetical protein